MAQVNYDQNTGAVTRVSGNLNTPNAQGADVKSFLSNQAKPSATAIPTDQPPKDMSGTSATTPPPKPDTTTQPVDKNQETIDQNEKTLTNVNSQLDSAAADFHNTMNGYMNGAIPLTPGEQAQVDGLKQQFNTLIDQQKLTNSSASGTAAIRGYQTGAAEYDPTFAAKTIGTIVSTGLSKVAALNTQMASAIASMTEAFKKDDMAAVQETYTTYNKYLADKRDQLQKTIGDAQKAVQDNQDRIDKQKAYELDVQKFQETKDQNAFDNALKVEQEKFAETNKTADLAETSRHNRASEALDAFKSGYGAGGNASGLTVPSATITATGAPDPVSQKAVLDAITQKYGPMTATAIQGLADYSLNPSDWTARAGTKGINRADAVALAKMVDPTYDDNQYANRAAYLKDLTSGTMSQGVLSGNKAINHLVAFTDSVSKLMNSSSFSKINSMNNFLESHNPFDSTYQSQVKSAETEATGLKDEMAKFFKGTGSSDISSVQDWSKNLDVNASRQDQHGLIQGAINLLAGQLDVMNTQYKSTMGKEPNNTILQPATMAKLSKLKDEGYQVDIPGVLYTDKTSWQNNGGTQEEWSSAVDALTKAGLPLTQDNILQMAQSL